MEMGRMRNKWSLFKLRVKTAYTILFKPKRLWIFISMGDKEELVKFLKGDAYDARLYYHRMTSPVAVDIMKDVVRMRKQYEDPSEKLSYDLMTNKGPKNKN